MEALTAKDANNANSARSPAGDVQCFGGDCYALAFGVPAVLMIVALGERHVRGDRQGAFWDIEVYDKMTLDLFPQSTF